MKVNQKCDSLQHKLTIQSGAEAVAAASFSVVLSALAAFVKVIADASAQVLKVQRRLSFPLLFPRFLP